MGPDYSAAIRRHTRSKGFAGAPPRLPGRTSWCDPGAGGLLSAGAYGATAADLSVAFVSRAARDSGTDTLPTRRRRVAIRDTRSIGLATMLRNDRLSNVRVHPGTGQVTLDGDPISSPPAQATALSQLYFL